MNGELLCTNNSNNSQLPRLVSIGNALAQMIDKGYCYLNAEDFVLTLEQQDSLSEIQNHFDKLPLDQYDELANRYRQLGRYVLLPFANILAPYPDIPVSYKQDIGFNREANGIEREFASVPKSIRENEFLHELIWHDFSNSPLDESMLYGPVEVGVHFIRLKATQDRPGIAVPNCLHKDGEPFTWIHLINRTNVVGGENVITDNSKERVLCEATLKDPLDSIGIVDDAVWHMVKPVGVGRSADVGVRDVLLIDFTKMMAAPSEPTTLLQ